MPTAPARRILVVDDDPETCELLRGLLDDAGYRVRTATTGARALRLVGAENPDLVLLDLGLRDGDGLLVGRQIRQGNPRLPIVVLSGTEPIPEMMRELDVAAWLTKPYEVDELLQTIRRLCPLRLSGNARPGSSAPGGLTQLECVFPNGYVDNLMLLGWQTAGLPGRPRRSARRRLSFPGRDAQVGTPR